jgi:GNAT superfamily N-acetyltransferase
VRFTIARVDWFDPRAVELRTAMDQETRAMYAAFTSGESPESRAAIDAALAVDPEDIVTTILAVAEKDAVGHAALRPYAGSLEVKKVFVPVRQRGRGIARLLMGELENVARGRGAQSLVLQTGVLQVPAITLYEDLGYAPIDAYGKYVNVPGALCFEKTL